MSQGVNIKIKGLYTHPNELSEVPEGALATADNLVINKESVAESRRGLDVLDSLPSASDRADKLFTYQNKLLVHYGSSLAYYNSGFTPYSGSYSNPDNTTAKMKAAQANSNFYFT